MLGAILGAGASILGGVLSKPKRQSAAKNSRDSILGQAEGARLAAEKYGFNPLTLLGVSSAVGPSESANYLGSAIADAGLILADGYAKREDKLGKLSQLQQENIKLRKKVQDATLRPVVGGIYAQRHMTPSLRQSLGVPDAVRPAVLDDTVSPSAGEPDGVVSVADLRPLPTSYGYDARRETDHAPTKSHSGFLTIDNPRFYPVHVPTGDGDEPLGIDEIPTYLASALGSGAYALGRGLGNIYETAKSEKHGKGPVHRVDGQRYQQGTDAYWRRQSEMRRKPKPGWMTEAYGRGHY